MIVDAIDVIEATFSYKRSVRYRIIILMSTVHQYTSDIKQRYRDPWRKHV